MTKQPLPEGFHVHHIDGDKGNNRLDNLELLSHGERRQAATDGGRYFVMCFASSDQVDAFLRAVKVDKRDGDLFVDGRKVADRLGIDLPPDPPRSFKLGRIDPKMAAMVRKPGR